MFKVRKENDRLREENAALREQVATLQRQLDTMELTFYKEVFNKIQIPIGVLKNDN